MQAAQPAPSVGVLFNLAVTEFVEQNLPALDHLAVIPDRCRMDAGPGSLQRTFTLPVLLAQMNRVAGRRSAVLNGIGMSFCSADVFDRAYLDAPRVPAPRETVTSRPRYRPSPASGREYQRPE